MTVRDRQALEGIRVLDVTDDLGAYAARLLSDLGADVLRIEIPNRSTGCALEPRVESVDGSKVSLFDRFVNAGKQRMMLDLDTPDGMALLDRLAADADVLIESSWQGAALSIDGEVNQNLIHVVVTPFGRGLNPAWGPVDDLIVLGAGGLLNLGGYHDAGPIAAYGGQSRYAASIYAAAATVIALIQRERSGRGNTIDVSAQECIAQALEDSVPTFALTGVEQIRHGSLAREAGSGIYSCSDGYVSMVAGRLGTARAWAALVEWLNQEAAEHAEELLDSCWSDFPYRQTDDAIESFRRIFEGFGASRSKMDLYEEAQRRGIALSPVSDIGDLIVNPQLLAREFFVSVADEDLECDLTFPGSPYRLSLTPPAVGKRQAAAAGERRSGGDLESGSVPWGAR